MAHFDWSVEDAQASKFKYTINFDANGYIKETWLKPQTYAYVNNTAINGRSWYNDNVGVISTSGYDRHLYLFACNLNGTADQHIKAKLWTMKIWNGSRPGSTETPPDTDLIFDVIPCKRTSDDKVGLYECVSGQFLYSLSATPLVAGPTKCNHVAETFGTARAATCLTSGITTGQRCSTCGEIIVAQQTIPALGHLWGNWIVDHSATETQEGARHRTCGRAGCDAHEDEVIPMVGATTGTYRLVSGGKWASAANWTGVTGGTYPRYEADQVIIPSTMGSSVVLDLEGGSYSVNIISNNSTKEVTFRNGTLTIQNRIRMSDEANVNFTDMTLIGAGETQIFHNKDHGASSNYANFATNCFSGTCVLRGIFPRLRRDDRTVLIRDGMTTMDNEIDISDDSALLSRGYRLNFTIENARFSGVGFDMSTKPDPVRFKVVLGENNNPGDTVISLSGPHYAHPGSDLTVDATAKGAGVYTILSCGGTLSDDASLVANAQVSVGAGFKGSIIQNGNDIILTITAKTEPEERDTYYLVVNDESPNSSFSQSGGWNSNKNATSGMTHTVSDDYDYAVKSGKRLRTANSGAATQTFLGHSLTLESESALMFKSEGASDGAEKRVTIHNLISKGGYLWAGTGIPNGSLTDVLAGSLDLSQGDLSLYPGTSKERNYRIESTITGSGALKIRASSDATEDTTRSTIELSGNASAFTGTISTDTSAGNNFRTAYTLKLTGSYGGSIAALPSSVDTIIVNYAGLSGETGLRIASTTIPAPIKTTVTFYGSTDFTADNLPLLTFPAGTTVVPTQFTVKHAATATGTATAFENLAVVTNGDSTITLIANYSAAPSLPSVPGHADIQPEDVFNYAKSDKPITYPTTPSLSGTAGVNQTISFGGKTVPVPVHYTASLSGNIVSIELNGNARANFADTSTAKAVTINGNTVSFSTTGFIPGLYYAISSSATLDGDFVPPTAASGWHLAISATEVDGGLSVTTDADCGFFRIVVRDTIGE